MTGKLAFIFPGQGSQSVGMLANLATEFSSIRTTFDEASEILGYDVWQLIQHDSNQQLNQTEFTQPAILTASVALWRAWQQQGGVLPAVMAGHSLGEYSALVCANSISFSDGLKLVQTRGRLMQQAVPEGEGAMAAVLGLEDTIIAQICREVQQTSGLVVAPANFNAIGQIVVSGSTQAVLKVIDLAREKGAKLAKQLPVSVPSHCPLMQPAADKLKDAFAGMAIQSPTIPIIHNADVQYHASPAEIKEILLQQLHQPVRWVETIQRMHAEGVTTLMECGPGKVLAGLNRRIEASQKVHCLENSENFKAALQSN
ncbi:MAG: ACP S-malonyltransferase [Gammaproteobacteria bacterium]